MVQWSLGYVAAAWTLLQGLEYASDTFHWPQQYLQLATVTLLLGLPVVAVLAWYHGDRGHQRVSAPEIAILVLLAALGGGVLWNYHQALEQSAHPGAEPPGIVQIVEVPATDGRPTLAVLPFRNRSEQPDDRYFVDGVHDDILTQLSKISALRVISRTSVERFRDTELAIAEIAAQLGANRILEGGVQRAGDRVRVTVQLIDTGSDTHLWAETYDRELSAINVFAIQSEIAGAIATALEAAITPAERARVDAMPTRSLEAWEAFQLGRQRMATRNSQTLHEARGFLERAIALDPDFAQAHALLGDVWLLLEQYGEPWAEAMPRAEAHVERALELAPDLAEAVTSTAAIAEVHEDFAAAEAGYRRAIELNPNYATAHHWYSGLLSTLGRPEDALRHAEKALRLDPLAAPINIAFAGALESNGRVQEALARYRKVLEIDPRMANAYFSIATLQQGAFARPDEAIVTLRELERIDPGNPHLADRAMNYADLGDQDTARKLLLRAADGQEWGAEIILAFTTASTGDWVESRRYATQAVARYPGTPFAQRALRNVDIHEGRAAAALARYAAQWPGLVSAQHPPVDATNWIAAIDVVPLLQAAGETLQATRLLDACERFIGTRARLGSGGYGIADVQIRALRGDQRGALRALREARSEGWSAGWIYYRDVEPSLALIRQEPEFQAVFAEIEAHMAALRAKMPVYVEDE